MWVTLPCCQSKWHIWQARIKVVRFEGKDGQSVNWKQTNAFLRPINLSFRRENPNAMCPKHEKCSQRWHRLMQEFSSKLSLFTHWGRLSPVDFQGTSAHFHGDTTPPIPVWDLYAPAIHRWIKIKTALIVLTYLIDSALNAGSNEFNPGPHHIKSF